VKSPTRQVLDLCRRVGVEDAVVPALAAVWKRHAAGQPGRNDFEAEVHAVLDGIPPERRASLARAFERFEDFRRLGTDTCVFTDRLGGVVASRPLEREEFAAELLREGFRFGAQKFFHGSGGEIGGGQVRPWRRVTAISEDTGPQGVAAWPWITAIRPRPDSDNEFGNTESFLPPPGGRWQPLPYQFDQVCELRPALGGRLEQDCRRVEAPEGSLGPLPCPGGGNYNFGSDCLRIPSQAAGAGITLRGFNFLTPSVRVHLQSRDDRARPVVVQDCTVWGDRQTPRTRADGSVIADMTVHDHVDVTLPREDPGFPGAPFTPGLYDVWISLTDNTDPAGPVERVSNRLVVRIEPRPDIVFRLTSNRGRCEEATSGPGDDEIWWDAFVGRIVPVNEPLSAGEVVRTQVKDLRHVRFPREPWSDMDDGSRAEYACELFSGPFELDGVVCVGIMGLEVDSERAARELLRDSWELFLETMGQVALIAVGAGGAADGFAKLAEKAGIAIAVSPSTLLIAGAVAAAVTIASVAFWAAWAPADIVGIDVFTLDAATASGYTDARVPLPGGTERSWRVEEEWMVVRERPQPKVGNPGERFMTWVQENEYLSPAESSRYVLEFRLSQR
jgi:hypothetical protein